MFGCVVEYPSTARRPGSISAAVLARSLVSCVPSIGTERNGFFSMSAGTGWLIRASGSSTDLPSVIEALTGGDDLAAAVEGRSLCLRSPIIDRLEKEADAEWAAY